MRALSKHRRYFIIIPLFAALIWFSSLLAMLLTWLLSGQPKYVSTQVTVVYISDVGASFLKPLFVIACCITGPGLLLSLTIERLLRHKGRLSPEHRKLERILGRLAIVGAFIAMCGLAFLSGFDTRRYPTAHMIFLLVFILGVALSAIFSVVELGLLAHDYAELDRLKRAYLAKAVIGLTLVLLAIAFGFTLFYVPNVGGVIEWTIAFGFTLYLLTFGYDLWMVDATEAGVTDKDGMVEIPSSTR